MTKQEQIKSELLKLNSDLKTAHQIDENLLIANLTSCLNDLGIINFFFSYRETLDEVWLQCEYYSDKLKKNIIFQYEVSAYYTPSEDGTITALDDFSMALAQYEDEINVFESRITFNQ